MGEILTYRGLISDYDSGVDGSGIERILLSTKKGEAGYRIVKLQLMPNNLNSSQEACFKIYTVAQSVATFEFDFSDTTLLAAARYTESSAADTRAEDLHVIFDHVIVNQDIYLTHKNNESGIGVNYYIELERIKLNEQEAMVTTIQNIRNR